MNQQKAHDLLIDRNPVTAAAKIGRFTYRLDGRWFHEDDVTQAFKDAELDYEESQQSKAEDLVLCEGRR